MYVPCRISMLHKMMFANLLMFELLRYPSFVEADGNDNDDGNGNDDGHDNDDE